MNSKSLFPTMMSDDAAAKARAAKREREQALIITQADRDAYMERLRVTPELIEQVLAYGQRTPEWFEHRLPRITASDMAAAIGMGYKGKNSSGNPRIELVRKKLWNTDTPMNADMERGVRLEPVTNDRLLRYLTRAYTAMGARSVELISEGLRLNTEFPWLASSNDGFLRVRWTDDPVDDEYFVIEDKAPRELHAEISDMYYIQTQAELALGRWPDGRRIANHVIFCEYVQPEHGDAILRVRYYAFDPVFWEQTILPAAKEFYFGMLLPAFLYKERGLLEYGQISPSLQI